MFQSRKRVLHIIQSLGNGGCENMLLRTLPLLRGIENEVLVLRRPGELAESFTQKGIKIHVLSQRNLLDIGSYQRLVKILKTIKPDLVVTYLLHADIIGRIIIQVITKISVVPFLRTNYNHPHYRLARWFERFTKVFVKNYLANSEAVKNYYVSAYGINPKKFTVIPNGIDVSKFTKTDLEKKIIKEKLEITADKRVLVCVANFSVNKGHKYLLEAFEKVYEKNKNILLLLVGDGAEKDNLCRQVDGYKSKEAIRFMGQRRDVDEILAVSEIFILPTFFEGFSNAILEAMASGLAVVTTDIPENRVIIESGKSGILIPTKNAQIISDECDGLLCDEEKRKKIGDNAQKYVSKNLEINTIATSLSDYLRKS